MVEFGKRNAAQGQERTPKTLQGLKHEEKVVRGRSLLGNLLRISQQHGPAELKEQVQNFISYVKDGLADGSQSPAARAFADINRQIGLPPHKLNPLSAEDMNHMILAIADEYSTAN